MRKPPITPAEFCRKMKEIEDNDNLDTESAHGDADDLMCSLLEALEYDQGVKVFRGMDKWYA